MVEEMEMDSNNALEALSRIRREADSQKMLVTKRVTAGMHKTPMRERLEYQNCIFYGAPVVSIEGENFWTGANYQRGVGFLGYWVNMEEVMDAWRVFFTPINGMRFDSRGMPIKNQNYVLHTLCAEGTFLVPKDGGISFLDDGNLVLLSKTGLLRGEGGWELAQEFQAKYRDILGESSMKSMRIEVLTQELDAVQEAYADADVQRKAALDIMKDQQLKYGKVMTTHNRFLAEKDALLAQLDAMHLVNDNLKMRLRATTAELAARVDDLLVFSETSQVDDSIRAHRSPYPKILEDRQTQLREEWAEKGYVKPTSTDRKLDSVIHVLKDMEKRVSKVEDEKDQKDEPEPQEPEKKETPPSSDNRFRKSLRKLKEQGEQPPSQEEGEEELGGEEENREEDEQQ